MHCSSTYQSPQVHKVLLKDLQPMVYHMDHRWKTRDLPSIKKWGLWLPLLYYKVTLEWWNTNYFSNKGAYDYWELINPPVVNEDNMIWAVKIGSNRLQSLRHLLYTSVDAIVFEDANSLIKYHNKLKEVNVNAFK
jgi:hypothetical protein